LGRRKRLLRCKSRIWVVWRVKGDMFSEDLGLSDKGWRVGKVTEEWARVCTTALIDVECGHMLYKAR
jgi:hypothetical protein